VLFFGVSVLVVPPLSNDLVVDFVDGFDAQFAVVASQFPTSHRHQKAMTNRPCPVANVRLEHTTTDLAITMGVASATNHPTTPSDAIGLDQEPTMDLAMQGESET
jgi:hypothetical protein